MKALQWFTVCTITILIVTVCTSSSALEPPDAVDAEHLVKGNAAFALDLYSALHKQEGNLFLSPYSISTALAMTYGGARGDTREQMAKALKFTLPQNQLHGAFARLQAQLNTEQDKGDIELTVANALWAEKHYSFLEDFIQSTNKNYGAPLNRVDFTNTPEETRKRINKWAEQKTNDKIKDLIQPGVLNALTRLVLTNAIYFKGNWSHQFKESETKNDRFWLTRDKAVTVPLMTQKGDFSYGKNEDMQLLALPYVGDNLSMLVLLPNEVDGLSKLETTLTEDTLASWLPLLRKREVRVFLPKFTMTSEFNLGKILAAMGMPDAFTPQADFSGMTGNRDLYINAVIHKAFVDVNEEGTEAAAATAVTMKFTSAGTPPPEFRADHPFLFLIRHNPSGSILFLGRVADPAQ
jgi:serpin B